LSPRKRPFLISLVVSKTRTFRFCPQNTFFMIPRVSKYTQRNNDLDAIVYTRKLRVAS
jgi:hypothetical protein